MAKKFTIIGIILVIAAIGSFMMMRRSHMMGAGSQGAVGDLIAVNAQGSPMPHPASQAAAGKLAENTALQETGGLLVSLTMDPYPPSSGSDSKFLVGLSDSSGQPVSDASISLDLTMPEMWMPPNQVNLTAGEAGKYQGNGFFTMRGLWRIEVIITRGGQKQSAFFDVGL